LKPSQNKALIVISILFFGGLLTWAIATGKPKPQPQPEPIIPLPKVSVVEVAPETRSVIIASQGTVSPKIEIDLVTQVSGQVQSVDDNFVAGGFFYKGQVLLQVDPRDYKINLMQARAGLAKSREALALEKGRALQAQREWRDLGNEDANNLFLRKPQLEAAKAEVLAAQANVEKAELDLERTALKAPFDGRVRSIKANIGQYLAPGQIAARVFATDKLEVRLPLTLSQAKLLGFESTEMPSELEVTLSANFGLETLTWPARLVRSEAAIDTKSRLFYAIAEVHQAPLGENLKPLLEVGLFVSARIKSRAYPDVIKLPRSALYEKSTLLGLDNDNSLQFIPVEVLQNDSEKILVRGLTAGMRIITEIPGYVAEGMHFQPRLEDNND